MSNTMACIYWSETIIIGILSSKSGIYFDSDEQENK